MSRFFAPLLFAAAASALAGLLIVTSQPVFSDDNPTQGTRYTLGALMIDDPWTRATPPGAPVAGGYFTVTNTGTVADRLVGGTVPFAASVEIHEMRMDGDVMKMAEIPGGLEIKPGETVELKPGGLHVMFMRLTQPLKEGETVTGRLAFATAGEVEVTFNVRAMGATGKHPAHGAAGAADDMTSIKSVLMGTFDKPDNRLIVGPVVVGTDWAVAGWSQGELGGRALLKRGHHGWSIHLCSGDSLKQVPVLRQVGIDEAQAVKLVTDLVAAEAELDPARLALLASFEGTVMMGEDGHHPSVDHGTNPGMGQPGHDHSKM
jgi:copper(I)-binding protein